MKMSHKWEETGHFRHLDMRRSLHGCHDDRGFSKSSEGHHLGATWSPWQQKASKRIRIGHHLGSPWRPPLQVATSFKQGKVATYGRHGDLEVQVGTSTPFAHGRHLLDGEKDDFHGDLLI